MRKTILTTSLFVILTLSLTQLATSQWKDNVFTNQSAENVYVAFTTYRPASDNIPLGWRTTAWYLIEAGETHTFQAFADNPIYYLILNATASGTLLPDDAKTYRGWMYRSAFKIVSEDEPDTLTPAADLLFKEPRNPAHSITENSNYFKSANTGAVTVTSTGVTAPLAELEETVDLPEVPETVDLPEATNDSFDTDPPNDEPGEPTILTATRSFTITGRSVGFFTTNYWYDWNRTVTFPGSVTNASVSHTVTSGSATLTGHTISGNNVTVRGRILAKTIPLSKINVTVTGTYESNAAAPLLRPELRPETDQLSAVWRDLSEIPSETALLPNYPNPFNPETWIPYRLAESADVMLSIYSPDGKLVRSLVLGHQPAGIYENKSRAVYWDGRNTMGERVASGLYFYTLTAGDFAATKKMLIMK